MGHIFKILLGIYSLITIVREDRKDKQMEREARFDLHIVGENAHGVFLSNGAFVPFDRWEDYLDSLDPHRRNRR